MNTCQHCSKEFEESPRGKRFCSNSCYQRQYAMNRKLQPEIMVCKKCGIQFTGGYQRNYCSQNCRYNAIKKEPNKTRKGSWELVIHFLVERDGCNCYLCGKPIDVNMKGGDGMAPSIDHVVPKSKGGANRPMNVKLTHWICNVQKGTNAPIPM